MPELFERYEIHETLGTGGMGSVQRARDTTTGQFVALKLITRAVDSRAIDRFRLEFENMAELRNPHIVGVNRFGCWKEQFFIDMQLVDGTDLARVLDEHGPLQPDRAVLVAGQVASALDSAHANELVHRDVKPANILITSSSAGRGALHCYLADFGITKSMRDDAPRLTSTNAILGTLDYMAPERIRGQEGDQRVDVYALACVLFQCVTGQPPYSGGQESVMFQHLSGETPSASAVNPAVPRRLAEVISAGMSKDPDDRPATAGLFAAAAAAAIVPTTAAALPVSHPEPGRAAGRSDGARPGRKVVAAAAAVVGLLVGAIATSALTFGAGQDAIAQPQPQTRTVTVTAPATTSSSAAPAGSGSESTASRSVEAPISGEPVPSGLVLPAAYAGDWQALVTPLGQDRDDDPYPLRMTLQRGNAGDTVGGYELPTLCSTTSEPYDAQLVAADSAVAHLKLSGGTCSPMRAVHLYPNNDGTLRAAMFSSGDEPVGEATLSKQ